MHHLLSAPIDPHGIRRSQRRRLRADIVGDHDIGKYNTTRRQGGIRLQSYGDAVALEQVTALRRAGADLILTYFARDLAEALA